MITSALAKPEGNGMAIRSTEQETPVEIEARIARLESDVGHVLTNVTEIKTDVRDLRARMDAKFDAVAGNFKGVDDKFDRLNDKLDRISDGISAAKISGLLLYFGLAATLLGVMARGFGWI